MESFLERNSFFSHLYRFFDAATPSWLAYLLAASVIVFVLVNGLMLFTMALIYMERRLIGRFQVRLGPNRVGPFGLLQPVADAIKILFKEDLVPVGADRITFNLAPVLFIFPVFLSLAVVPFGERYFLADLNVAVLFIMGVSGLSTIAILMAGWSSANRYAMFGAVRAVAQLISYEVPMVLSLVGVLLLVGSMSMVTIVEGQRLPLILLQPLGFLVFFMAALAELNRTPFDLVEAESELVAGYHTEYSGMKFGMFMLAEFAASVVSSAIIVTVFFKGWEGPLLPSHLWFVIKLFVVLFVLIWIRATLPRLRIDQIMAFAWKVLFPLSLVNIAATAVEVLLWPQPTTAQIWAMVGINWGVTFVSLALWSWLMGPTLRPNMPQLLRGATTGKAA
ncbi:MAG: NADH-quinone oxidoreductase subunit NuoH [Chloroflexi bacterium]|nr:NADH-quinone oxidoreductase subunit NuoH [Chloroflexota bacterium]